mmetsp:Transcript_798/g.1261  ORF Transcript_798/g.1261 Transcript_798/m.1261 type:complete len:143 (-) Transcript_798:92-520(-)
MSYSSNTLCVVCSTWSRNGIAIGKNVVFVFLVHFAFIFDPDVEEEWNNKDKDNDDDGAVCSQEKNAPLSPHPILLLYLPLLCPSCCYVQLLTLVTNATAPALAPALAPAAPSDVATCTCAAVAALLVAIAIATTMIHDHHNL